MPKEQNTKITKKYKSQTKTVRKWERKWVSRRWDDELLETDGSHFNKMKILQLTEYYYIF